MFEKAGAKMSVEFAGEAWENAIDEMDLALTKDDRDALKSLGKLLGSTDMPGQLKQIALVNAFLDEQIKEATESKNKNAAMYRKLGVIVGVAVVIVLL